MKKTYLLTTAMAITMAASVNVQAGPYVTDSRGEIIRNNFGECWRTSYWTPDQAIEGCDGVMKKAPKTTDGDADKDGVADSKDQCPDTASGAIVNSVGCVSDSDADGIADSLDRCPNTGAGVNVDSTGCPVDSDADGVADMNDQCADTPRGIKVDSRGCEMDSDADGITDSRDQCPGTAAGVKVDATGCAITLDDDNDGIVNSLDQCPGTASGTAVDKTGCELEKAAIALDHVKFQTGTAVLDADSRRTLDQVADVLKANPHLKFEVAGHTDNTGNYQANVNLSQSRAQSVRQYLVDQGVAPDRLTAKGYGPDKPLASNDTRDGRRANRRVELELQ
jgi:OOP family OmpA-OmpF porin